MENESCNPTFISWLYHKEAWFKEPSLLGISEEVWKHSSLCYFRLAIQSNPIQIYPSTDCYYRFTFHNNMQHRENFKLLNIFYSESSIADSRFMSYLPSVVATATMLHVVNTVEPCLIIQYQKQLLGILGIDKVGILKHFKSHKNPFFTMIENANLILSLL